MTLKTARKVIWYPHAHDGDKVRTAAAVVLSSHNVSAADRWQARKVA